MRAFDLSTLDDATREKLLALIAVALHRGGFRTRTSWARAIVVLDERRATSRVDFAAFLRSHGVEELAHEALHTKTRDGEVLVYASTENESGAFVGFFVVDVRRVLAECTR